MPSRVSKAAAVCLIAATILASRIGPADAQGGGASGSVCHALAQALLPTGTMLADKRIADIIAAEPRSKLRMDPKSVGGLSLISTYAGSLGCQRNTLYRADAGQRQEISVPSWFAGGEGALWGGDKVRLAAVNGIPALIDETPDANKADLTVTLLKGSAWTPLCRLTVETEARYGLTEKFCRGEACTLLERGAARMADSERQGQSTGWDPADPTLSASQRDAWDRMFRLADYVRLDGAPLPTPGVDTNGSSNNQAQAYHEHAFADSRFFPILVGDDVLLGKIGPESASHSLIGSGELIAIYRFATDRLDLVARFYLEPIGVVLRGVQVSDVK